MLQLPPSGPVPPRRPKFSWVTLFLTGLLAIALFGAIFTPNTGNVLQAIITWTQENAQKYSDFWPKEGLGWEEKFRRTKEEQLLQQKTLQAIQTPSFTPTFKP